MEELMIEYQDRANKKRVKKSSTFFDKLINFIIFT